MDDAQDHFRHRPHPWHGINAGPEPPHLLNAYVEITPFDLMKYEMDKTTGYLRVDRPQQGSSLPPTLYGFVPRTYCADRVAALSPRATAGDEDPLDICVLTERPIRRAEVIVEARVIGVIRTLDDGRADDKIAAVLNNDAFWHAAQDISDVPEMIMDRLSHYFETYKAIPSGPNAVRIMGMHGRRRALSIVEAAMADYAHMIAREGTHAARCS